MKLLDVNYVWRFMKARISMLKAFLDVMSCHAAAIAFCHGRALWWWYRILTLTERCSVMWQRRVRWLMTWLSRKHTRVEWLEWPEPLFCFTTNNKHCVLSLTQMLCRSKSRTTSPHFIFLSNAVGGLVKVWREVEGGLCSASQQSALLTRGKPRPSSEWEWASRRQHQGIPAFVCVRMWDLVDREVCQVWYHSPCEMW